MKQACEVLSSPHQVFFSFILHFQHVLLHYHLSQRLSLVQAIRTHKVGGETKGAIYNLFASYLHTVPLEQLIESVERARRDAKLRYVVIHGAACSYCLARAERLEGSYLRTFALELKEQLAQTLAVYVTSILAGPRRQDAESAAEPPLRQIIDVLEQVMCHLMLRSLRFLCLKSARGSISINSLSSKSRNSGVIPGY
jgi:hypothetical protein